MTMRLYHVVTSDGDCYGTPAAGKRDAMLAVQERLADDGTDAVPVRAISVGAVPRAWSFDDVLCYGPSTY